MQDEQNALAQAQLDFPDIFPAVFQTPAPELDLSEREFINSLVENENYMSNLITPTTNLRSFADTFGQTAFGRRSEAVKDAYTNWNVNDNFNAFPPPQSSEDLSTEYITPSPVHKWYENENFPITSFSGQESEFPPIYTQAFRQPPESVSSFCTTPFPQWLSHDYGSLTTPYFYPPEPQFPSEPNYFSNISSPIQTLAQPTMPAFATTNLITNTSTVQTSYNPVAKVNAGKSVAKSPVYTEMLPEVPRSKPVISNSVPISSLDTNNSASAGEVHPMKSSESNKNNAASPFFLIPLPKLMPFTTSIHSCFQTPPSPKRYVTVREMIEEKRKREGVLSDLVIVEKRRKIEHPKQCNLMKPKESPSSSVTNCPKKRFEPDPTNHVMSIPPVRNNGVVQGDPTTLLCLLPVTGKECTACSTLIPPILITDFQNGKVNAKEHKPKHFEMKTLTIGDFKVNSAISSNGRTRNKVKIVFSKRTFIYEFEHFHKNSSSESKMISIEVSFQSLVAIHCFGRHLQLRVKRQPLMFEGCIKPRSGVVSRSPVYNKKQPVDISNGQLAINPVHRIILKRSQSNWLRESLVRFDPWFHALFATPIGDETPQQRLLPSVYQDWQNTCKQFQIIKQSENGNVQKTA